MECSICGKEKELPHETPDGPPFYPKGGGRHCDACQHWLLTGEFLNEGVSDAVENAR